MTKYFSQHFSIKRKKGDDWFDPVLDTDTSLFVDPFLIFSDTSAAWAGAHDELIGFFNSCFTLIAESNGNQNSVSYRKGIALLHFPEPREFCLGYSVESTRGAGGGIGYARLIAAAMESAIARGLNDLRHFEELGILEEGIGPDRISDLTCNVLRERFINYTLEVVNRHDIPTSEFTFPTGHFDREQLKWTRTTVNLPENPYDPSRPVLLTPQGFLNQLPTINANDWWQDYSARQLRNDVNFVIMRNVSKSTIVAAARSHLEMVQEYSSDRESKPADSYDFEKDPLGIVNWLHFGQEFVTRSPLTIPKISDEDGFIDAINQMVEKFREFVEERDGWKLLWNDDTTEKGERAAQLLFRGVVTSYCEVNKILIDREVDVGAGSVDFKFTKTYENRALLELKKLHSGQFWNNIRRQLPKYLKNDKCLFGWYVVVRYRTGGTSAAWMKALPPIIQEVAKVNSIHLWSVIVDARPHKSASTLKGDGDDPDLDVLPDQPEGET